MRFRIGLLIIVVALLATACAPAASVSPTVPAATAVPTTETSADAPASAAALPAWMTLPLTDARTGETFTFADYSGKTVLARALALWCTNCRNGQRVWRDEVLPQVDAANTVFVSMTIETNITAAEMATYADENGFPWRFAVMTPEFLLALNEQFGSTVNVPPAEPQWLIRPDSSVVGLISDFSPTSLINLINGSTSS